MTIRDRPPRDDERSLRDAVIVAVLFLLACWQYFTIVDDRPFHRDEARWIHRAEYVGELADPFSSYWGESTWIERGGSLDERYRLRAQPPLGSYLMGVGLLAQGRNLDTNGFWVMDNDNVQNAAQGNVPSSGDLTAARRTTAVVSALTVAVVYLIGSRVTNRIGGVAAALFLLFHPLVTLYAAFAGSDMLLVLLVSLAAMAAYRLADRPSWPRAVLLGVLLGLGGAAKLSPLGIAVPVALLGGLVILLHLTGKSSRIFTGGQASPAFGLHLLSVPLVAAATLIASYPYLWRAPIEHTRAMFAFRTTGMDLQASIWQHVAVDSPGEALRRVEARLGDEFTVLGRLGVNWDASRLELGVAVVGLMVFAWLVLRRGIVSGHGLTMVVLGGQAAITVIGMGADWARYHLPILLFVAVCIGVAVGQGWASATRAFQSIRQPRDGQSVAADPVSAKM